MAIRAPDGAKNGHILPTGQWYAPSAVINDAWYCMVLHGIAWYLEHKTCDILAAERLRLIRFDNRLIIDSFQEDICIIK